jgi:hypothetical protein
MVMKSSRCVVCASLKSFAIRYTKMAKFSLAFNVRGIRRAKLSLGPNLIGIFVG